MTGASVTMLVIGVIVMAVVVGIGIGWAMRWRTETRQLGIMTERLAAEQQIDAATRATLAAMRSLVRQRSH